MAVDLNFVYKHVFFRKKLISIGVLVFNVEKVLKESR